MKAISRVLLFKRLAVIALFCIWAIVLGLPRSRGIVLSALHPWPTQYYIYTDDYNNSYPDLSVVRQFRLDRYRGLQTKYPDDISIPMVMCAQSDFPGSALTLQKLSTEHPGDLNLAAYYLNFCATVFHEGRGTGPLSNPNWPKPRKDLKPLTPQDRSLLESMAAVSRRSSSQDPDNAFFDWSLILADLQLGREDEAVQILIFASQKRTYHNYSTEYQTTVFRLHRLEAPLSPVACLAIPSETWTSGISSGHREVSRQIMDHVYRLRSRGDSQGAIRVAKALMDFAKTGQQGSSTAIEHLIFLAVEQQAIMSWLQPGTKPVAGRRASLTTTDNLAGFARVHGNNAIAFEALSEFNRVRKLFVMPMPLEGWPPGNLPVLLADVVVERALVWTAIAGTGVISLWAISNLTLFWIRRRRPNLPSPRPFHKALLVAAGVFAIAFLFAPDICWCLQRSGSLGAQDYAGSAPVHLHAPAFSRAFPIVALVLVAQSCAAVWLKGSKPPKYTWQEQARRLGAEPGHLHAFMARAVPILVRLTIGALTLAFLGTLAYLFPHEDTNLASLPQGLFWALALFALVRLVLWSLSSKNRPAVPYFVLLIAESIPLLVLTMGLILGVAILAISPACAAYESQFRTALAAGEWAYFKTQMGL